MPQPTLQDYHFLSRVLAMAQRSRGQGHHPFAAIVVDFDGNVIAEASLLELTGSDPENPTLALPCREVFARGQRPMVVVGLLREEEARLAHAGFWNPARLN